MTGWRIWYADGGIVSSEDCRPEDIPPERGYGAIAIAKPDMRALHEPGAMGQPWLILSRQNYFYWRTDDGDWFGADGITSMIDLILANEPIGRVLQGRMMPYARYFSLMDEATAWAAARGLPAKTSLSPEESHPRAPAVRW